VLNSRPGVLDKQQQGTATTPSGRQKLDSATTRGRSLATAELRPPGDNLEQCRTQNQKQTQLPWRRTVGKVDANKKEQFTKMND